VDVTVEGQPTVDIDADNDIICIGGSSIISSVITDGSGFYLYQWQQSVNGTTGWANVPAGGNGPTYNAPSGVPGTTYYRVLVTDISNGCNDPVSNVVNIVVQDQPTVNITVDNPIVCVGGSVLLSSAVTNGSGLYTYQWQSSPDGSTAWSNIISGGVSATYAPTGTPGSFYYRVLVTDLSNGRGDPVSTYHIIAEDQPLFPLL
jgi:hypothetical protein